MFESWNDIKEHREEKGISLQALSEKMRLPVERIIFLEAGDFSNADPVIIRLQLKNYAQQLDLDYNELLQLCDLHQIKTDVLTDIQTQKIDIKKTRPYRGRRKEPSKFLIYGLIVIAVFLVIFILNKVSSHLNITDNLFEMTEKQQHALDNNSVSEQDSNLFRPVLPQATKAMEDVDITMDMEIFMNRQLAFPIRLNIYPQKTISYRYEIAGENPKEDFILKNTPLSLFFHKSGKMIFYNTEDTRFVLDDFSFRDITYSRIVIDIDKNGLAQIYTKQP